MLRPWRSGCNTARRRARQLPGPTPSDGIYKHRKKRYTRGLRDIQTTNRGLTRASRRLVRAVDEGMTRYLKESNKSARKKRDGAWRDFGLNVSDAIGAGLREASWVPADLARTFNTRGWRKSMRRSMKATARFNRRLFRMR
jgi:hypothetical protein